MNLFERTLIEKAGYAYGFENVRESTPAGVVMFSARHKAEAHVTPSGVTMTWEVRFPKGPLVEELVRTLAELYTGADVFRVEGEAALGRLLRRAAELAMSLPTQAADAFAAEMTELEGKPPSATEAFGMVKQRRGQELFRKALLEYWGGACAVTGLSVEELLRASHAKPWADCSTDGERLNVFNGFLLCPHLDALFDSGLMSFDDSGGALLSSRLDMETRRILSLPPEMRLRWVAREHLAFLDWHRRFVYRAGAGRG